MKLFIKIATIFLFCGGANLGFSNPRSCPPGVTAIAINSISKMKKTVHPDNIKVNAIDGFLFNNRIEITLDQDKPIIIQKVALTSNNRIPNSYNGIYLAGDNYFRDLQDEVDKIKEIISHCRENESKVKVDFTEIMDLHSIWNLKGFCSFNLKVEEIHQYFQCSDQCF
jgi:hypothetical protein